MKTRVRFFAIVLSSLLIMPGTVLGDLPPRRGKRQVITRPPTIKPATPQIETLAEGLTGEWLSASRPIGAYEDLTAHTGVPITGGLTEWGTRTGDRVVQHVAGRTPGGDLHVFWWNAAGVPSVVNVTAKTGVSIASDPIGWLGVVPHEHIAAITTLGDIQVFTWTPTSDWGSANISRTSDKQFSGNLVTWTTFDRSPPVEPVEHIAATTTAGEIYVFFRRGPFVPFSRVDVTAKTGIRAKGLGGAWVTPDFREHLIVAGADNKLYDLLWSSAIDWTASAISLPHDVSADLTAMSTWGSEHIAVRSSRDTLFHLSRPIGSTVKWNEEDLTSFDGESVTGRPNIMVNSNNFHISARGVDGEPLIFWRGSGIPLWQVSSMSDLVGMTASGALAQWAHDVVAAAGTDNRLRVIRDWGEARRLTEQLQAKFMSLRSQTGTRKTVTILWNPETTDANCAAETGPGCVKPCNRAEIGTGVKLKFQKAAAVSAMTQLGAYFRENSGNLVTVDNVATLGWYTSTKPGAHYWQPHGAGSCLDGWNQPGGGDVEKWVEAIRQADAEFNFAPFDTDLNKTLSANELAVVIMIPNPSGPSGYAPGIVAENNTPVVVDGVTIPQITEVYVESHEKPGSDYTDGVPDLGLTAHELSHHLFGHVDMYWASWDVIPPTALSSHALMDYGWSAGHHDPLAKLKFHWLRPRLIFHPGRYSLKDVETRHTVRVLLHPTRGTGEYFIFENRFRGTTFDKGLRADGLAIYHVMEDPAVYQRSRPPFHWTDAEWAKIGITDWGHRSIRMIRPVATNGKVYDGGTSDPYDDFWSVWRAGDPRTSYDLTPFPAARGQAWLRWADGTNPGLAIRGFTAGGPEVKFTVGLVSLANPSLCAAAGKNCGWIPDGFGGMAYCGECSSPNGCGGGGVPNVCGCTPKKCEDGFCGTLSDGCGGRISCGDCEEGYFCNRWNRCEQPPEPCKCGGRPPACFPCPEDPLAKPKKPPLRY